jgi:hypothetical protein
VGFGFDALGKVHGALWELLSPRVANKGAALHPIRDCQESGTFRKGSAQPMPGPTILEPADCLFDYTTSRRGALSYRPSPRPGRVYCLA